MVVTGHPRFALGRAPNVRCIGDIDHSIVGSEVPIEQNQEALGGSLLVLLSLIHEVRAV